MSEGAQYSLILDGQPVTVGWDELVEMARDGRVTPATMLTIAATGAEVQAQNVLGLFDAAPPRPESPPVSGPPASPYNVGSQLPPAQAARMGQYVESQSSAPPKSSFPVWAIVLIAVCVVGCGCCLVGPAILFPVFSQAKVSAKRAASLSNMKQLALGVLMYSSDWDDKYPPSMESATATEPFIETYVKNPALFVDFNPAGGQILGDTRLNGLLSDTLMNPAGVVMFYDERDWSGGVVLAAYSDGHGRQVTRADVDAELAAKLDIGKPTHDSDTDGAHPPTPKSEIKPKSRRA